MPKGTPEDLINALNMRIDELSGSGIESSTTIEADGRTGWTTEEVLDYFDKTLGWDITDERVQNYADAVAEYLDMGYDAWRQAGYDEQPYTLEQWYEDTKMNYPDEIAEFEELYAATDINKECPGGVCEVDDKEAVYGDDIVGNIYVSDIVWDTDYSEGIDYLPTEVTIDYDEILDPDEESVFELDDLDLEERINDYLSDNYGFLVETYSYTI